MVEGVGPSSQATWAASWEEEEGTSCEEAEDGAELEGSLALPPSLVEPHQLEGEEEGVDLHEGENPGHYSVVSSSEVGVPLSYERA